ncbi:MAG: hypothetical protein DHS20C14_00250 [Phycisphaeraceae bacterium]|nr:MAG: hypothetical protein DHS20C14_00250 [Phycisphaeraceae bacterium]
MVLMLIAVTIAHGEEPPAEQDAVDSGPESATVAVRTVRIPGTVEEFELVEIPSDSDGDLWVARTEVAWELYDIYLYALDVPEGEADADAVSRPSKPYVPPDRGMGHAGYPAIGMTRQAAQSFCDWLEVRTGLAARLPTPAEFTRFAAVDVTTSLEDLAWTNATSERTTHPTGRLAPNALGLYDTIGNVAEWVMTEGKPVAMGGSYLDDPESCTPQAAQRQLRAWNQSDPQIPKSRWWLADCSWVGFRFVVEEAADTEEHADE